MEKQGMDGGAVLRRPGLLALPDHTSPGGKALPRNALFLPLILRALLWTSPVFPQSGPVVTGEASPASLVTGSFWTVSLLVDHPSPEEVEVRLPALPGGLSLDRVRTEPRLIQSSSPDQESRRWTSLQYRFLVRNPGRIDLAPFEVLVNGVSVPSPAFSVTVRNPSPQPPRAFWRNLPPALTAGEEAILVLCIEGESRPGPSVPGPSLPPVPAMIIMEVLAPEAEDELLSLRVIPLEGPFFTLPSFPFPLENRTLQVPALRIPVRPAPPAEPAPVTIREEAPPRSGYPPFPSGFTPRSGIFAGSGREIQARSRILWEEGQVVEALAELRRNERDHPAGFSLVELRRALEQALGLEAEPDEVYSPRLLLIPALLFCLILAALSLTLPAGLMRTRSSAEKRPQHLPGTFIWLCRIFSLFFSIAALFCLFRLSFAKRLSLNYGDSPPRQALARETALYRVPDDRGTEIARLTEGQGLLVYEIRNGWAYAEAVANNRSGWIKTGTYLVY